MSNAFQLEFPEDEAFVVIFHLNLKAKCSRNKKYGDGAADVTSVSYTSLPSFPNAGRSRRPAV